LGLLGPLTPRKPTQRSTGVSALTLLNAAVQELIAINCDRFNLLEAYISSVESPCTVDSTSSNLRLLPWLDIGIVSTLPRFLHLVLQVVSTPQVVYLSGYHTLFNLFRVPPRIPTYDIQPPREDNDWSYCSGNIRATSVYRVSPGWGSRRVTHCLANPEAVADSSKE
jgi:hypothetical protein